MQAIMLAAGKGSRLGKYTKNNTKCMLNIHGKTLLERAIDALIEADIKDFIIVLGYKGENVKEYIEEKYGFKVHTAYIAEVKRNLGLPMYDAPNMVEELKQPRRHPTAEKVEAIKDALKHFGVI